MGIIFETQFFSFLALSVCYFLLLWFACFLFLLLNYPSKIFQVFFLLGCFMKFTSFALLLFFYEELIKRTFESQFLLIYIWENLATAVLYSAYMYILFLVMDIYSKQSLERDISNKAKRLYILFNVIMYLGLTIIFIVEYFSLEYGQDEANSPSFSGKYDRNLEIANGIFRLVLILGVCIIYSVSLLCYAYQAYKTDYNNKTLFSHTVVPSEDLAYRRKIVIISIIVTFCWLIEIFLTVGVYYMDYVPGYTPACLYFGFEFLPFCSLLFSYKSKKSRVQNELTHLISRN